MYVTTYILDPDFFPLSFTSNSLFRRMTQQADHLFKDAAPDITADCAPSAWNSLSIYSFQCTLGLFSRASTAVGTAVGSAGYLSSENQASTASLGSAILLCKIRLRRRDADLTNLNANTLNCKKDAPSHIQKCDKT